MASFDGTNGSEPSAVVMDAEGNLYGLTGFGGSGEVGSIYEIPKGANTPDTLASFNQVNGDYPTGGLAIDATGNLYGVAGGGADGLGEIFEFANGSGVITVLASFNGINGEAPQSGVVLDSAGNLYGTTDGDGQSVDPTVFEVAKDSGVITTLATFTDDVAAGPNGVVLDSAGDVFGTTTSDGPSGDGTIFEVAKDSNTTTTLAAFNGSNGSSPAGTLAQDATGNFYGATTTGGTSGDGVIFELPAASSSILTLASFNGSDGNQPNGSLTIDTAGNLYGTTSAGGASDNGTAFELPAGSGTIDTVASFGLSVGSGPDGGLIADSTGSFYGATSSGGTNNLGTVFILSPLPTAGPAAKLGFTIQPTTATAGAILAPAVAVSVEDTDGNVVSSDNSTITVSIASGPAGAALDGSESVAAVNGVATFSDLSVTQIGNYSLTASDATLSQAVSAGFTTSAALPEYTNVTLANLPMPAGSGNSGGVVIDSSGNLYGTTESGGANGDGSVFEVARESGIATTLVSFNKIDGASPSPGLIIDPAGNLYGTTKFARGVVFEVPANTGAIIDLARFQDASGDSSLLALDASGNLYGSNEVTGALFEIVKSSGVITNLNSGSTRLRSDTGVSVYGAGDLFGVTRDYGANGYGTIFELAAGTSTVVTLASFNGTDGAYPTGTLVIDSVGDLFGITTSGGTDLDGTLFELAKDSGVIDDLASFSGTNGLAPTTLSVDSSGNLYGATSAGGADNQGTVFESPKGLGVITTLASFNGIDGANPQPILAVDSAGDVYGTAAGGTDGNGLVFELSPTGIGDPDVTFDASGLSSLAVGLNTTAGMALQPDGKSVVAGAAGTTGAEVFGVIRYNADGSLDTTFGDNGVAETSFGGDDVPAAVTLLTDGNILVAGTSTTILDGQPAGSQFALAEYTSSGVLDTAFGNGTGRVLTSFSSTDGTLSNDIANAIAVGPSGAIFVGGSSDALGHGEEDAIAAYTPSGAPKTAFGAGGKLLIDSLPDTGSIDALAIASKNVLIAAGSVTDPSTGDSSVAVEEVLATSGALDTPFGDKGRIITKVGSVDDSASSVAIDKKGDIVVGGYSGVGSAAAATLSSDFLLLRYSAAGKLDKSFGSGGIVLTSFDGQPAAISRVLIEADGSIFASGKITSDLATLNSSQLDVAVARYNPNGALDLSFNSTGQAIFGLSGEFTTAGAVAPDNTTNTLSLSVFPLITAADATSDLMQAFMQLTASDQGAIAVTSGGDLLDVGSNAGDTVEAAIVAIGVDLATNLTANLPSAAVSGAKGVASVMITETGTDLAAGKFAIDVFFQEDGTSANSEFPVEMISEKLDLKEDATKTVEVKFQYPASLPNGEYHLAATINTGTVRDLNLNNNTSATSSTVLIAKPFVQLVGSDLSAPAYSGTKPVFVSFTVMNAGNATASTPSAIQCLASTSGALGGAISLGTTPVRFNLKPSATHVFKVKITIAAALPPGTYYLLVLLDPSNIFNDPNAAMNFVESDNTFVVA